MKPKVSTLPMDSVVSRKGMRSPNPFSASFFSTLKIFFSGKHERAAAVFSLLANIIIWVAVLIKVGGDAKPIPLHFSAVYGIDYVDSSRRLYLLPLIGLLLGSANFYLAARLHVVDIFSSRLVGYFSVLLQVFLLLGVLGVIYLNR